LESYEGVLPGFTPGLVLPEDPRPWLAWLTSQGFGAGRDLRYETIYRPAGGGLWGPARYPADLSDTAFLVGEALSWLGVRDRPWFLHLSLLRPHPPWVAPEPYHRLHDPADMPPPVRRPGPAEESAQHPLLAHLLRATTWDSFVQGGCGPVSAVGDSDAAQARAVYFGLVAEVDRQLGRLFDALRAAGVWDDTLVVVTSDHGEMLGDHYLFGKRGYFDQAFHIPLIVRDPRPAADAGRGGAVERFTEAVDVMPTVLDWLGLEPPPQCDGDSLLPFCAGTEPDGWRRHAHWEFDFRDVRTQEAERALGLSPDRCSLAAIRGERFKYVHFAGLPPLFFDLVDDPHELVDRSGDPALRGEMLEHAQAMLSWRMAHADRDLANMQAGPGGMAEWRGRR
jgi:arylsulfatase A-like enzyme